jgi:hypothetical protein
MKKNQSLYIFPDHPPCLTQDVWLNLESYISKGETYLVSQLFSAKNLREGSEINFSHKVYTTRYTGQLALPLFLALDIGNEEIARILIDQVRL